jgi:hypothetical protein
MAILRKTVQAGNQSFNQGQDLLCIPGVGKTERQGNPLGVRFRRGTEKYNISSRRVWLVHACFYIVLLISIGLQLVACVLSIPIGLVAWLIRDNKVIQPLGSLVKLLSDQGQDCLCQFTGFSQGDQGVVQHLLV